MSLQNCMYQICSSSTMDLLPWKKNWTYSIYFITTLSTHYMVFNLTVLYTNESLYHFLYHIDILAQSLLSLLQWAPLEIFNENFWFFFSFFYFISGAKWNIIVAYFIVNQSSFNRWSWIGKNMNKSKRGKSSIDQ